MTNPSPELLAFAAHLGAEPETVEDIFQYCRATLWVEEGQAELVKIELRGREPWCVFKTIHGDKFAVLRPSLSPAEEREMIETLGEILHSGEVPLAEEGEQSNPFAALVGVDDSAAELSQPEVDAAAQSEYRETAAAQEVTPPPAVAEQPEFAEEAGEVAQGLRQLVEQARTATERLQGIIEEVRQVTEAAWVASKEQRLILAEMRTTLRQYERIHREPESPPHKHPVRDRDQQLTLAILEGMTVREAGQKFGLSNSRIKKIYTSQFRRLYRLQEALGLSHEDLAVIKGQGHSYLLTEQRSYASRIRELLEKMWAYENQR